MIYEDQPNGKVKNALMAASPYLSDEVLIAAISNKPSPLPPGHIMQIINANSPVTEQVMTEVENRSLPNGIKNQIDAAQIGISDRKILEKKIDQLEGENQLMENELVKAYLDIDDVSNAKLVLENSESVESKILLNEILFNEKDYNEIRTVCNQLLLSSNTENFVEIQEYNNLMNCLADLLENGKNIFEMDSLQEQTIREVAASGTYASVKAESILMTVFNEEFEHPIMRKQIGGAKSMQINNNTDNVFARIYPNPNNGKMYLEYKFEEEAKGELIIYNVIGIELLHKSLENDNGKLEIIGKYLKPGIYFYKVVSNSETIIEDKIIIL